MDASYIIQRTCMHFQRQRLGISNVKYISTGKSINTKSVNVMCFDFQMPFIEKYVGDADNVEYYTYDSEKVLGTEDTR